MYVMLFDANVMSSVQKVPRYVPTTQLLSSLHYYQVRDLLALDDRSVRRSVNDADKQGQWHVLFLHACSVGGSIFTAGSR